MPHLNLQTNVPADGVLTSDLLRDASKAVARALSKPESVRQQIPLKLSANPCRRWMDGAQNGAACGKLEKLWLRWCLQRNSSGDIGLYMYAGIKWKKLSVVPLLSIVPLNRIGGLRWR